MTRPKRILVADDDKALRNLLYDILTTWGHEVEIAEDGFEALAKLELDIDLLVTDAMMPGLDGFEVVRQARASEKFADLPIIMVTGLTSREDRIRAAEVGANDFISKPLDFTELNLRTKSLLRMKEMHDNLKENKIELERTVEKRTESLRRTLSELVSQQRQLRDANLESIHRLVVATEYRDADTAAHIRRMSQISALLARKIRLSPKDVELVLHASPMHDIGKIATPVEILLKPGKLNAEEWDIMRKHTHVGADILKDSSSQLLRTGELIAISHHEKWNGKGYPNGLAGEDIPIEGRVCAVADVFDALTSKRPYKEAFSTEESLAIIQNESGKHFDPRLVEALSDSIEEVVEVRHKFEN